MELSPAQRDRARGALLATAAGDALGAPYEFEPPRGLDLAVAMTGGRGWEPGEWTDDTAMAVAIAQAAVDGDLLDATVQAGIVHRWQDWAATAKDVGTQTRTVLTALGDRASADDARAAARAVHERTGRSGGNGSLMRTAPVALAYLDDEDALATAAAALSALTHFDPEAGEACVLWCLAIRGAVLTGEPDVRLGLARLPGERAALWSRRLDEAEAGRPADFPNNGWVVTALQAAWSALSRNPTSLSAALDATVRAGFDTDTVAAIAGGVAGATHGAAAVPVEWTGLLHGWPGLDAAGLVDLADAVVPG